MAVTVNAVLATDWPDKTGSTRCGIGNPFEINCCTAIRPIVENEAVRLPQPCGDIKGCVFGNRLELTKHMGRTE